MQHALIRISYLFNCISELKRLFCPSNISARSLYARNARAGAKPRAARPCPAGQTFCVAPQYVHTHGLRVACARARRRELQLRAVGDPTSKANSGGRCRAAATVRAPALACWLACSPPTVPGLLACSRPERPAQPLGGRRGHVLAGSDKRRGGTLAGGDERHAGTLAGSDERGGALAAPCRVQGRAARAFWVTLAGHGRAALGFPTARACGGRMRSRPCMCTATLPKYQRGRRVFSVWKYN
jgi:hypothetical protein